jgi:hypothetical protein
VLGCPGGAGLDEHLERGQDATWYALRGKLLVGRVRRAVLGQRARRRFSHLHAEEGHDQQPEHHSRDGRRHGAVPDH